MLREREEGFRDRESSDLQLNRLKFKLTFSLRLGLLSYLQRQAFKKEVSSSPKLVGRIITRELTLCLSVFSSSHTRTSLLSSEASSGSSTLPVSRVSILSRSEQLLTRLSLPLPLP